MCRIALVQIRSPGEVGTEHSWATATRRVVVRSASGLFSLPRSTHKVLLCFGGISAWARRQVEGLITGNRDQEVPTPHARARPNNAAAGFQLCRSTGHWDSHLHPRPLCKRRSRSEEHTGRAYVFSYGRDLDRIIRTDCQQSQLTNREPWLLSPVHVRGGTELRDFQTRFLREKLE